MIGAAGAIQCPAVPPLNPLGGAVGAPVTPMSAPFPKGPAALKSIVALPHGKLSEQLLAPQLPLEAAEFT